MPSAWAGACIGAMELRRTQLEFGRAMAWVRTHADLPDGKTTSATARAVGTAIVQTASPYMSPVDGAFPDLDLMVHLFRSPVAGWPGLDTIVSFGPDGIGVTHSVLHDLDSAFEIVAHCLTVRPP